MRVVAGAAKGRPLAAPPGRDTRPTSDRAREGLFSTLESLRGLSWTGARVLDLYAGSGAVGLEALSRGAEQVVLVESDVRAAATIRRNAATVGLPGARVVVDRVERYLAGASGLAFDVVFLDPPYAVSDEIVARVLAAAPLAGDGVLAVERSARSPEPEWPEGVAAVRERRYGEGVLWYGRRVERPA
ncbi:MAG TPA: 16S rRNA (guanine(966)-N(2))-methyltransferase RsmD [Mycobacteriales bacterium]|jgi:16S rRNA (guanine966-N2)-methyltransferase|nr:16S rRNA (guanine(966)-N(2))-methyltransferase RsmD [Mycobacteriales bacterium]